MNAANLILVFGSKVLAGGEPSGSLRRRTMGALEFAQTLPGPTCFLLSGTVGEHPPSEADVMGQLLLEAGVSTEALLYDRDATDTLDSVVNARAILQSQQFDQHFVCTDDYHAPRCATLYRLIIGECSPVYVHGARRAAGQVRWLYYCLRELVALPWDTVLAMWWRWRH